MHTASRLPAFAGKFVKSVLTWQNIIRTSRL